MKDEEGSLGAVDLGAEIRISTKSSQIVIPHRIRIYFS